VTSSQEYQGSNLEKIAANLYFSVVPVVAREPDLLKHFDQPNTAGKVRDWTFIFYQVNAIFGMGLVGGPLILWLAYRELRRQHAPQIAAPGASAAAPQTARRKRPPGKVRKAGKAPEGGAGAASERRFWLVLIVAGVLLGIAVVGERDPLGVAHLTLLALQALGLSMLAAVIPWRRRSLAILLLAGCAVDFSLGVLLQARIETLSNSASQNWYFKHRIALHTRWLAELEQRHGSDPAFRKILPNLTSQIATLRSDDAHDWQGWFGRHGGEIEFLGDRIANRFGPMTGVGTALLVGLFLGLAGIVVLRTS
jgi:hypothetical protein